MRVRQIRHGGTVRIGGDPRSHPQARRVDLVVTDYQHSGKSSDTADALRQEFRCTIPLAYLDDEFSSDVLHEVARACRSWMDDPISTDEFLHLVEGLSVARKNATDLPVETTASPDRARVSRLTPRERQVLDHVVAGDPNKRTAVALNISRRTVEHHRAAIMHKTHSKSVSELVRLALRAGLCEPEDGRHA